MQIDKTLALAAPPAQVWALLLDTRAMATCVPGLQALELVGEGEYLAQMQVKLAFINARFKLRTQIVERLEPQRLVAQGSGEDTAVASSLKHRTEMQLSPGPLGGTTLQLKVQVEVFGRIGSFGLAAMKTKADRLWDEFGVQFAAQLAQQPTVPEAVVQPPPVLQVQPNPLLQPAPLAPPVHPPPPGPLPEPAVQVAVNAATPASMPALAPAPQWLAVPAQGTAPNAAPT